MLNWTESSKHTIGKLLFSLYRYVSLNFSISFSLYFCFLPVVSFSSPDYLLCPLHYPPAEKVFNPLRHGPFSDPVLWEWVKLFFSYWHPQQKVLKGQKLSGWITDFLSKAKIHTKKPWKMWLNYMSFILHGKSEIGAHVKDNLCYSICLRHLVR